MTTSAKDEEKQEPQQQEAASGDEHQAEEEPKHPGWLSLGEVLKKGEPLFTKSRFLLGYDFSCNIYVLGGDYLTVVDPGNDYTGFMEFFRLGFHPADIKKIVLTHGHRDHAMGTFELLRYPSIMENKDFQIIVHKETPAEFKAMITQAGHAPLEVSGGETLELSGYQWEVIYTPGHTIDGISLYHAPSKTAFTGDTVMPHAMAEPDKNAGGGLDKYLYGVKALLKRDIENILPGHGAPVAGIGKRVVEDTYEALMMKIIGVEDRTPWMAGATALAQKGLLEEAVFCCDKELARRPENPRALELKALCLNDLGRCREAIELLDKILAQNEDDLTALVAKGHALLGLGRYDESLKYFDQALGINPGIQDAQLFKGMALYLSGRYDEAMDIEVFRKEFVGRFKEEVQKMEQGQQAHSRKGS